MVDAIGHLGMALIWVASIWFVVDTDRAAGVLVATGFWFGLLPDVDVYLSNLFQDIHHHGVVHTLLAVTLMAVVLGPALGWTLKAALGDSRWFPRDATRSAYSLGFATVWIALLSHIFADMLSAPDIASRIEPLWPLYNGPIVLVDVFWYNSPYVNWGLLLGGIVLNGVLWYWTD